PSARLRCWRAFDLGSPRAPDLAVWINRRNSPRLNRSSACSELMLTSLPHDRRPEHTAQPGNRTSIEAREALLSVEMKCYNAARVRVSQKLLLKLRYNLLKSIPVRFSKRIWLARVGGEHADQHVFVDERYA